MSKKLYIIKIGGNVIDNPEASSRFLESFSKVDGPKILVHGGGKIATQIAASLQVETQMVDGRRITDKPMLDVVTMVYGGLVNKNLVAQLQSIGVNAIGMSGADGGIIRAVKRPVSTIDYGFVGDIVEVNGLAVKKIVENGFVPVIAPLTFDSHGQLLNTNADTMASSLAVAMSSFYETILIYCFEKKGVLSDPNDEGSVIPTLNIDSYQEYKAAGIIYKGMIPKLDNAFDALSAGVGKVVICHGDDCFDAIEHNFGTHIKIDAIL